jgi:glycosyltransferase A (GT-A) superfamily protein (DUF2064 family)
VSAATQSDREASGLVVFLRRPARGVGKQRLARALGAEAALRIGEALLDCALEDAAAWPQDVILAPAAIEYRAWAEALLPRRARVLPQAAGNLGERITAVDAALRALGYRRLLYIGSDAPGITGTYLRRAEALLGDNDVVLGPARDGGVALMAARRAWPPLAALPWSTATLGDELARCCRHSGLQVASLDVAFDVDEMPDLQYAAAALASDPRAARRRLCALIGELRGCALEDSRRAAAAIRRAGKT